MVDLDTNLLAFNRLSIELKKKIIASKCQTFRADWLLQRVSISLLLATEPSNLCRWRFRASAEPTLCHALITLRKIAAQRRQSKCFWHYRDVQLKAGASWSQSGIVNFNERILAL